jgi:SAM-dependent methyltransferase
VLKSINTALKQIVPDETAQSLRSARAALQSRIRSFADDPRQIRRQWVMRACPICEYEGRFWSFGSPPRAEALCPHCLSLERHRLLYLLFQRHLDNVPDDLRVLHFAPEPFIRRRLERNCRYVTVDFSPYDIDCACAMEKLPFADGQFDLIIANHVLEHVEDESTALSEIRRVLDLAGTCILSVPQIFGWEATYEDESIVDPDQRRVHFGQTDHRRLYGRDFARKLCHAGFYVETFQMDRRDEIRFALSRGETLYLGQPVEALETPPSNS